MPVDNVIDVKSLSFEVALKELEEITRSLETGEASLEDSITLFERGSALKAHCDEKLKAAQMRVEQIVETQNGFKAKPYSDDNN
jgi:exodeoxyribonuclease VII small subunit